MSIRQRTEVGKFLYFKCSWGAVVLYRKANRIKDYVNATLECLYCSRIIHESSPVKSSHNTSHYINKPLAAYVSNEQMWIRVDAPKPQKPCKPFKPIPTCILAQRITAMLAHDVELAVERLHRPMTSSPDKNFSRPERDHTACERLSSNEI